MGVGVQLSIDALAGMDGCVGPKCVCVLCVVWSGSGLNLAGWLVRERQEEIDYYRTYISTYRIH